MDARTWKLIRRSAGYLPLALAATHADAHAQNSWPAQHGEQEAGTWVFHHEHVLGTSLELKVRASDVQAARKSEARALAEFDREDRILSAWRLDSEFSRWQGTKFVPTKISPELIEVLSAFDQWRAVTNGALDASAEAAIQLWRRTLRERRNPTAAEMASTREAMAQEHWSLDPEHSTATRLTDTPLALASFAKSYVTERAAQAAMHAGARGVMLNVGGDIVVRGDLAQTVHIADGRESSDNAVALDVVRISDRAIATSGCYKRGIEVASVLKLHTPEFSHLIDPRTASPAVGVLSSTVIARNAKTAGALATALAVMSPEEGTRLADSIPEVDYLLVAQNGTEFRSKRWSQYQAPGLRNAMYVTPAKPAAHVPEGIWNPAFELAVALELPRIDDARYRRPYIAVWVEDADRFPVRTLALWTQNPRWLPELKSWYRDDQIRNLAEGTDVSKTIGSATRPPGHYLLKWDGKDNEGKPVKGGKYTVVVEASREHGGYQIDRKELDFSGQPQQATLSVGKELGAVTLDYRKR